MEKSLKILVADVPFADKSAIIEYLLAKEAKEADVIIIQSSEMDSRDIAKIKETSPQSKPFVLKRYDVEPLPQEYVLKRETKPWQPPPGHGKKYQDKHNFRKRL